MLLNPEPVVPRRGLRRAVTIAAFLALALAAGSWLAGSRDGLSAQTTLATDLDTAGPDAFFGLTRVHSMELTLTADDFDRMPPPGGRGGRGFGRRFGQQSDDSGYPKVPATLEFEGRTWGAVTIRYKGNSSYRSAPSELKRSLKIEFDKPDKDREFFGLETLNLNNNAMDDSQMREALAYDVFRRAGVPAPRTAFVRLFITVPGKFDHEYAGLFTAIEQIDQRFFRERWGKRVGVLVKPESVRGMPDLGTDWPAYETAYSSKITADPADARRLVAFIRFLDSASDDEFATGLGEYLDVDSFLHFLAAEVLTVNTDSPLAMNHNYWLTVHPQTKKVVWLPWDLNMAFGGFMSGDADLSLTQPSAPGLFPLADRVLSIPSLAARYRAVVEEMVATNVTLDRLGDAMTQVAAAIRPAVREDPAITPARFERNLSDAPSAGNDASQDRFRGFGRGRTGPPLRRFVIDRLESVAAQLAGTRPGTPGRGRGFGGFGGPPPFALQ
jgi:hypothetical protein